MHISEGVLSGPVVAATAVGAVVITAYCLKKTKQEDIPGVSVLTAAYFVVSLLHIKLGVASVHLQLSGLMGIILGLSAFPAILIALLFQAVMFGHGGLTTLGANALAMGLPALFGALLFRPFRKGMWDRKYLLGSVSFLVGMLAILISGFFIALFLALAGREFLNIAYVIFPAHIPLALIEGVVTLFIVLFLRRVKPDMIS